MYERNLNTLNLCEIKVRRFLWEEDIKQCRREGVCANVCTSEGELREEEMGGREREREGERGRERVALKYAAPFSKCREQRTRSSGRPQEVLGRCGIA